jgi:hypothetical protein
VSADVLTDEELTTAGEAFAELHSWAGSAWRSLSASVPPPTRKSVLATVDELAARLAEVRAQLGDAELPSANGRFTGTGWV